MVSHHEKSSVVWCATLTFLVVTLHYISKCSVVWLVVFVWCAWSLDKVWHLWVTTEWHIFTHFAGCAIFHFVTPNSELIEIKCTFTVVAYNINFKFIYPSCDHPLFLLILYA